MTEIPVTQLEPHKKNSTLFPQVKGDDWVVFLASIETRGILQPLVVTPSFRSDENYTIVSGHNRCRAAMELGIEKLPCEIREYHTPQDLLIDLIAINLDQRQYTAADRVRLSMELLGIEDDLRKKQEKDSSGRFAEAPSHHSGRSARMDDKAPSDRSGRSTGTVKSCRRERIQARSKATRSEYDLALALMELPHDQTEELIGEMQRHNLPVRSIKEKVNALNADRRKLKAEIRDLKKDRIAKRDMERVRDYQAAQHDPDKAHQARTFDTVNRAINDACIQANTMVSAIFAAGKLTPDAARVLEPGVKALAIILEEQLDQLKTGWRNISRDLQDIGTHGEDAP